MKPLLSLFIDGLRPESIEHMPFLDSFREKHRIKGEYGYSIACHGSMYSGVHTDRHKLWFVWQRSPDTSPFRKIKYFLNLPFMDNVPGKLFLHKTATLFESEPNTSFFGIPRFVHVPLRFIKDLDVTEKRNYDEPGYLTEVPSLFDILRQNDIEFDVIGMDKSEKEESKILDRVNEHRHTPWIYWFMGDVDHFSHEYGQGSAEGIRRLGELDELLKRKYEQLVEQVGDVDFLLWSDHGHIDVIEKIDIYEVFKESKRNLNDFLHVIDGTYARFWYDTAEQEQCIRDTLESMSAKGEILEIEDQIQHRVYPGDNRFGDIVFSLNPGYIFNRTIWGWSRKMKSMHGYDPNYPESDGVLISNIPIKANEQLQLIDITPSIMERLGLAIRDYMEGKSFWAL